MNHHNKKPPLEVLEAVGAWHLDDNSEPIRQLLPHATTFHGALRPLLEGLALLFHGGASLGPVEAVEKLEKAGKKEEAKALEAMLEAVPERQSSKGRTEKTAEDWTETQEDSRAAGEDPLEEL